MAARGSRTIIAGLVVATAVLALLRPVAAQALIKFTLEGPIDGATAPYFVALDKGYFERNGLVVRIDPAATAQEPITRVASGAYQMGVVDLNVLIRWRDQNPSAAIKPVFIVYNRPPYAIVARKSRGIAVLKDLEGKRLGAPPASASSAEWALFAKLTKIDAGKVKVEPLGVPVRDPMLAAGQIDAIAGYDYRIYVDLKDRGVPVNDLLVWRMADFGMQLYGNAIVVNTKFAADHPSAVTGFLEAFLHGLNDTVTDPAAAIGSVLSRNDLARKTVELARLQMAIANDILTPEVRKRGYGDIDPARMQVAINQLKLVYSFRTKPTPATVFDPSFLPPMEMRQVKAN